MRESKNVVEPRVKDTYNIQARKNGPTSEHGCLAQLGEHLFDVQEVTGSIPVAPTMLEKVRAMRGFSFVMQGPTDYNVLNRGTSMKKYRHTRRSVILFYLLTPLTIFIYPIVVLHHMGKETNQMYEGVEGYKKSMPFLGVFFLGFITLGIVPIVWLCRVSGKIGKKGEELGIQRPHTSIASMLLLCILFGWLVITHIIGMVKFLHACNVVERRLDFLAEEEAKAAAEAEILPEPESIQEEAPEAEMIAEEPVVEESAPMEETPEEPEEESVEEEPADEPAPFEYVTEIPQEIEDPEAPRSEIAAIYHVAGREDIRKWQVRVPGTDTLPKLFDSEEEAIAYAKGLAARRHATVRVKKK